MTAKLEDVLKSIVGTVEEAYSPLIVSGLRNALARIAALEAAVEAAIKPKPPAPTPVSPVAPPKPAATPVAPTAPHKA